ncbi:MAG: hypothetical protein AAFY16_04075, partial [Cyanobacteria bacterium J06642_3]
LSVLDSASRSKNNMSTFISPYINEKICSESSNTDNLSLIKAISPSTRLIHWSDYRHPEVIELLYSLGINSFCTKESDAEIVLEATDLAANYPQSLYMDQKLHQCLPLLQN